MSYSKFKARRNKAGSRQSAIYNHDLVKGQISNTNKRKNLGKSQTFTTECEEEDKQEEGENVLKRSQPVLHIEIDSTHKLDPTHSKSPKFLYRALIWPKCCILILKTF